MSGLSPRQRAAAAVLEGPVRIVAGPGTGKTAVIAERFRALVEAGVEPASILVMTFTERAAAEMRSRIEVALGRPGEELNVGTFHATALAWLREDGVRAGIPAGFRILAGADRWILLRELLWELGDEALAGVERPDDLVTPLLRLLERMKQELVPVARLRAWAVRGAAPDRREVMLAAARLFEVHARRCRAARRLDFDDLLVGAVRLLTEHPKVRERYRARFRWLMVDEYQDTNLAQERIVELLAGPAGNVCVVGDDDQSIYRFRGASRANLDRFERAHPGCVTVALGTNRRSRRSVVRASARLIEGNPDRLPKRLAAAAPGGEVGVWSFGDGDQEAGAIAAQARRLIEQGLVPSRIAVLTRTNAMFRPVIAALGAAEVPYQTWGARGFFDRPEVRDVLAHLRLLGDPGDEIALARLIGARGAGLDEDLALEVVAEGRRQGRPPLDSLAGWGPAAAWVGLVRDLVGLVRVHGVDDLLFELLERTRLAERAPAASAAERSRVAANLGRFAELVGEHCEQSTDHSLGVFLARLELVLLSEVDAETAQVEHLDRAVQVMTIHQAKGLEFDAVFVPGVVEGRLPQPSRTEALELPGEVVDAGRAREDNLAEERRLCYVAMTRARSILRLSWAERYEGGRRWRPSRFLTELAGAGRGTVAAVAGPRGGPPPPAAPPAGPPPAPPPGDPIRLSFTAVSVYRECPRQYWYRYRHRVLAPDTVEGRYGTLMHDSLRRLGEIRIAGDEITDEVACRVHDEVWRAAELPDPRRRPALSRIGLAQLRRLVEAGGFEAVPAAVERHFVTDLDGWRLSGIIDRIDRIGGVGPAPGAWRLVDYKTGAPVPAARLRRDLQLALYSLGAGAALGISPGEAGQEPELELEIAYLRTGRRVMIPASPGLRREAAAAGREVAEAVAAGDFAPRPARRRCRLCAYRLSCADAL